MTFDYQQWVDDLQTIPQHQYNDALRAMMAERDRRSAQPFVDSSENETAAQYHAVTECPEVDGVPVWQQPPAKFAGYPSGYRVHHEGTVWENTGSGVAMGEPGVSPEWVDVTPPPEESDDAAE